MIEALKDTLTGKVPVGTARSPHWPTTRKHFLEKNQTCAVCGGKNKLQVHHKQPFHLNPALELDESNLIVLCEDKSGGVNCHLWFGHLGNYKHFNPEVEKDAALWKAKYYNSPTDLDGIEDESGGPI